MSYRIRALTFATATLAALAGVAVAQLPLGGSPPVAAQGRGCQTVTGKAANPSVVPLGYSTQVTLSVRSTCPFTVPVTTRVVLAIDSSEGQPPEVFREVIAANRQLVTDLRLPDRPAWSAAVLDYSPAVLRCGFTNDEAALYNCLGRVTWDDGNQMSDALTLAHRILRESRARDRDRAEVVVVEGHEVDTGCSGPNERAAAALKSDGIRVIVVAVDPAEGMAACWRAVASPGDYHEGKTPAAAYRDVAESITPLGGLTVWDVLPANMRLVDHTVQPAPSLRTANRLEWRMDTLPARGVTLSFWATPLQLGDHPTNQSAGGELISVNGQRSALGFPVPVVKVVDSVGLPTATALPTFTPTPVPTRSGHATPVPTVARTAVPRPTAVPGQPQVCPGLAKQVPAPVIADALANPAKIGGWGQLCRPNLPPGPANGLRTWLSLQSASKPYHPLFNGLVFKCGCP